MQNLKKVQNCAEALQSFLPREFCPAAGVVLGTGLGAFVEALENSLRIPYQQLADMPLSTAQSHENAFVAGELSGVPVLVQQGRSHLYEGRSPSDVCTGVRVMASLGVRVLVITNAAGALNPLFNVGTLMAVTDHINLTGTSPLTGPNEENWGPRFPDMSRVYDERLLRIAFDHALRQGMPLEKGVYVGVPGPQLETPAETRACRILGGDAVGMSTVLEAVAARHMGVRILGLACLTNKNLPDCMAETGIEDIIAAARSAGGSVTRLLAAAMPDIARAVC